MRSSRRRLTALALAMLAAAAAHAGDRSTEVQVRDPWVRWLPGQLPAGGYLTLINDADQSISLVGASCPDYGTVSLHRSQNVGSISHMMAVDHIAVAPHSTLSFASEGYHLMLERPSRSLKPGDHVAITLRFSRTPPQTVSFELRAAGASEPMPTMPGMSP